MGMVNSSKGEGKILSPLILGRCSSSLVAIMSLQPNLDPCENPLCIMLINKTLILAFAMSNPMMIIPNLDVMINPFQIIKSLIDFLFMQQLGTCLTNMFFTT
jgi:hypothetical protein